MAVLTSTVESSHLLKREESQHYLWTACLSKQPLHKPPNWSLWLQIFPPEPHSNPWSDYPLQVRLWLLCSFPENSKIPSCIFNKIQNSQSICEVFHAAASHLSPIYCLRLSYMKPVTQAISTPLNTVFLANSIFSLMLSRNLN